MNLVPALGINIKDYNPDDILKGKLWRITEKIDGVRRLFYKDNQGKVRAYSRSGKADPWLTHIVSYLEDHDFPNDIIYDTELVDIDLYVCLEESCIFNGNNVDSYTLRAETISKAAQQYPDNKKDLSAVCFDMFRPGDLTKGAERSRLLMDTFKNIPIGAPIFGVPYYGVLKGYDQKNLEFLMTLINLRNGEGLMLMNLDAPYIPGRSKELIKVKRHEEFIGKVIGVEIAKTGTKIEGGIAALICEIPGCTIPVSVGSGFTKDERLYFMAHPPFGKMIEIDAFSRTKNEDGNISLSVPIFKQVVEPDH